MHQIHRFLIFGSINTIVYYALYSFFLYMSIGYKFASLFATILGVFFSFKTLGRHVFSSGDNDSIFYKFLMVYSFIYVLNITFINAFNAALTNYYVSGFLSILLCAFISFLLNKYFVFKIYR
jgi:putative flippase GtrA